MKHKMLNGKLRRIPRDREWRLSHYEPSGYASRLPPEERKWLEKFDTEFVLCCDLNSPTAIHSKKHHGELYKMDHSARCDVVTLPFSASLVTGSKNKPRYSPDDYLGEPQEKPKKVG